MIAYFVPRVLPVVFLLTGLGLPSQVVSAQEGTSQPTVLSLEEALLLGVRSNREIRDARLALEVADGQVREAWGNVYPTIDASASYTRNISPAVSFLPAQIFDPNAGPDDFIRVQFGTDNNWNSALTLEQPLFQAQAFVGVGAAGRFKALQEEVVRGTGLVVATRIRTLYYDLLLRQEQARLTENSVERVRKSLEETQALARAGLSSEYDVLRLEVELANLLPTLRRAENQVSRARRDLAVELDLDPEGIAGVEGSLAELDLRDPAANSPANRGLLQWAGGADIPSVTGLQQALSDRTDVRQSELNAELRQVELRLEQAEYLPRVTLFGNYIIDAQQQGRPAFFGEDASQRSYQRNAGIRVSVPVFTGFQRRARVSQKRAALRQAELQVEVVRDRAEVQIRSLMEELDEAGLRAEAQRQAVAQATRGFDLASAQYREGLSSQLEVTDAELALRQSEFNYAEAVFDALSARARLEEALGRLTLPESALP
ncbi:MAG: TolC family protein [Gemmatimonadota bacterium]